MKRKKWSELEEETLLSKYSELLNSGTLSKLKTREKKFKPIADHVNSVHHLLDPINFPFRWSWRDVSIKVQNMRHQYLNVKQKIRVSDDQFNWEDGDDHWENFLKYKQVFGDVEIESKEKFLNDDVDVFGDDDVDDDDDVVVFDMNGDDDEDDEINAHLGEDVVNDVGIQEMGIDGGKKLNKGFEGLGRLGLVGGQVLALRQAMVTREEKRKEREFNSDEDISWREKLIRKEMREEVLESWEMELEDRQMRCAKKESEQLLRLERALEEERERRMRMEEKREEEEMEWRQRMVSLQIEHEKAMMQMHVDTCQNQMQILMVMARLISQFLGSPNDGLGGGLGSLPPQVLQNLQHPSGSGDNGKPDSNPPSEFL